MWRKISALALGATILVALCPSTAIAQSKAKKIASAMTAGPAAGTPYAHVVWPMK